MTRIDDLPADRRAVLELLVRHGKSYDEVATMLRIEPEKVRERARDSLDRLGPLERKDGWPAARFVPERARIVTLSVITVASFALFGLLSLLSNGIENWDTATAKDWITFAGLNFIAGSAIIHVAIWERRPLHGMMEGEGGGAEPAHGAA